MKKSMNNVPKIPTSAENDIHNSSDSININDKSTPVK